MPELSRWRYWRSQFFKIPQSQLWEVIDFYQIVVFYFTNRVDDSITDQGLKNLSEGLKRLNALQSINLSFQQCPEISDEGLESLSKTLQGLTTLQSVNLNFQE